MYICMIFYEAFEMHLIQSEFRVKAIYYLYTVFYILFIYLKILSEFIATLINSAQVVIFIDLTDFI